MTMPRRDFMRLTAVATGTVAVEGLNRFAGDSELRRVDPFKAVLEATARHPLVGLGDPHLNEQFHAFLRSLIRCPALLSKVDDFVIEFGNAHFQDLADRFFLRLEPVQAAELSMMWRTTIGGRVYWDAPVYERFYRTVRSVNEQLPRDRRIRVILGDVPIDWSQIRSAADAGKVPTGDLRETFLADVVEREVLAKDRRALLVVGGNHLRRGIHTTPGGLMPPRNPDQPSAGSILASRHSGTLFVVLPFSAVNAAIQSLPEGVPERMEETMAAWPAPSLATLANTWLAPQPMPDRALDPASTFGDQADAILWLGSDVTMTCARPDRTLYESGDYADELRRRSEILSQITGNAIDLVAEGLRLAGLGPSCSTR